jgi:hypothetical protein
MQVLSHIPQDGTFDQTKPLDNLVGSSVCYSFDLKSATDRWPLLLLFEIMQYCFDRSFASSVVNSALASNVFEVPFVKRKASRRFIRSRATARVSCLFSLSSHSPTIYWCGGVRNRFTLD